MVVDKLCKIDLQKYKIKVKKLLYNILWRFGNMDENKPLFPFLNRLNQIRLFFFKWSRSSKNNQNTVFTVALGIKCLGNEQILTLL